MRTTYIAKIVVFNSKSDKLIMQKIEDSPNWVRTGFGAGVNGSYSTYTREFNTVEEMQNVISKLEEL